VANRTPTSHDDDQPTEPMPVDYSKTGRCGWVERSQDGSARRCAKALGHEATGDPEHRMAPYLAAPAPTGAAAEVDPHPAPSMGDATPEEGDASVATGATPASADVGSGGTAGAGRPQPARDSKGRWIGRSRRRQIEPTSDHLLALLATESTTEQALIDYDAAHFLEMQHYKLRMARTLLDAFVWNARADGLEALTAVEAGLVVRLGHDDGSQP